eukprot:TRINITY_DN105518_c0_g1_i1.p2 TRINITY_DN105518_c0_g1~~TRINITY_DN105518_c0_g1_i1.p2  ORF type:complete len:143 (+),score=35.68 TRINITY_DN105518_c0_g1_i1:117-545(+)
MAPPWETQDDDGERGLVALEGGGGLDGVVDLELEVDDAGPPPEPPKGLPVNKCLLGVATIPSVFAGWCGMLGVVVVGVILECLCGCDELGGGDVGRAVDGGEAADWGALGAGTMLWCLGVCEELGGGEAWRLRGEEVAADAE